MNTKQFNTRLAKALKECGMKQSTLAKKTGITESSISHYIKGDRFPSAKSLARIADTLEVSQEYLLNGEEFVGKELLDTAVDITVKYAEHLEYGQKVKVIRTVFKALLDEEDDKPC